MPSGASRGRTVLRRSHQANWLALLLAGGALTHSDAESQTEAPSVEPVLQCDSVQVRTAVVSLAYISTQLPTEDRAESVVEYPKPGAAVVHVQGPILGSMDSRAISLKPSCVSEGVLIEATISRSAQFTGAAAKNVLWRPIVAVTVSPYRSGSKLQVSWKMKTTDGRTLTEAQTVPFAVTTYPQVVRIQLN